MGFPRLVIRIFFLDIFVFTAFDSPSDSLYFRYPAGFEETILFSEEISFTLAQFSRPLKVSGG